MRKRLATERQGMKIAQIMEHMEDLDNQIKVKLAECLCFGDGSIDPEQIENLYRDEDADKIVLVISADLNQKEVIRRWGSALIEMGVDQVVIERTEAFDLIETPLQN
jgi:hypothetical protein